MKESKFWNSNNMRISLIFNIVLMINIFILSFMYIDKCIESDKKQIQIEDLQHSIQTIDKKYQDIIDIKDETINNWKNSYEELYNLSLRTIDINKELLQDCDELEDTCNKIQEESLELKKKVEVYETYEIFMYDTAGKRSDCSYELLDYLQSLIEDKAVNNLPFYCAWIMIESEWHNNCLNSRSSAYGLPQFLPGSGKWVYEDIMGNGKGTYYHELVTNPTNSLPMMVAYVHYLLDIYAGDLHKTIDSYRGFHDTPYLNRFNKYLAYFDTNIDKISDEIYLRYLDMHQPVG